jgi:hypothetical protein
LLVMYILNHFFELLPFYPQRGMEESEESNCCMAN